MRSCSPGRRWPSPAASAGRCGRSASTPGRSLVEPAGDDGLRIRETVDNDFGSFDRHGYERRIPNDFGVPTDVEATSPDAPDDVTVEPDPERPTGPASASATPT